MKEKLAEDTRSYQRKTNRTIKTTICWECYFGLKRSIFKTNRKKKKRKNNGHLVKSTLWKVSVGWCLGPDFCRQPYCREWLGGDQSEANNGPLIVTLQAHGKPLKLYLMVANPMISQLLYPLSYFTIWFLWVTFSSILPMHLPYHLLMPFNLSMPWMIHVEKNQSLVSENSPEMGMWPTKKPFLEMFFWNHWGKLYASFT